MLAQAKGHASTSSAASDHDRSPGGRSTLHVEFPLRLPRACRTASCRHAETELMDAVPPAREADDSTSLRSVGGIARLSPGRAIAFFLCGDRARHLRGTDPVESLYAQTGAYEYPLAVVSPASPMAHRQALVHPARSRGIGMGATGSLRVPVARRCGNASPRVYLAIAADRHLGAQFALLDDGAAWWGSPALVAGASLQPARGSPRTIPHARSVGVKLAIEGCAMPPGLVLRTPADASMRIGGDTYAALVGPGSRGRDRARRPAYLRVPRDRLARQHAGQRAASGSGGSHGHACARSSRSRSSPAHRRRGRRRGIEAPQAH